MSKDKKIVRIDAPKIPNNFESMGEFLPYMRALLAEEKEICLVKAAGDYAENDDFGNVEMRQSLLEGCVFQSCEFRRGSFVDVVFKDCDFSNSRFLDAYFERCTFVACKCVGCDLSGTLLKHVSIQETNWQYSYFDHTKWSNVELLDSDFTEVSVSEAELKHFTARGSCFMKNNFFKTKLAGIDFRENEFVAPIVSDAPIELRGILVSPTQAVGLAAVWGIRVE